MRAQGNISVNVRNQLNLDSIKVRFKDATFYAETKVAQRLLEDSKAFVPVLTGQLKDSASVQSVPPLGTMRGIVRVLYDTPYARTQHEDSYWHPSLGFHGAARYMLKPIEMFGEFYRRLYEYEFRRFIDSRGDV